MSQLSPKEEYLKGIDKRVKESRVYVKHQSIGLEIAEILEDMPHKALYIKLAKENDGEELLALAKRIAENKDIKNKGGYFMRVFHEEKKK